MSEWAWVLRSDEHGKYRFSLNQGTNPILHSAAFDEKSQAEYAMATAKAQIPSALVIDQTDA